MRLASTAVFTIFVTSGTAQADWLDTVWSKQSAAESGHPSITLGPDSVSITLPTIALEQAYREGYTTRSAALAFLRRYGQCSRVLDLGKNHNGLTMLVSVQKEQNVDEEIVKQQEYVLGMKSKEQEGASPHRRLKKAFGVSDPLEVFVVDYTPGDRNARCVVPGAPGS
ncbi:MAG TPA: hypothetical protein VFY87_22995 [Geminicoccaceae bacterium]|nr:hypothetical protein [Geminicoccaceae bacterium]